ncbi:DNA alkylation repair protein [Actinoplanes sp. TBRC 11911]|uniref:DNA alkylation repair protein n=1 Tax=Actinoplanes sp. TBRC 11911 TaxID=2729386 RepID=UPI00145ED3B9|nr:DNA alkylation repair protein [Actinoplanes sp. TBRC 11911]NMO57110.1 DNA alkylation repair protein [Actinoplanes sp. TBRC 11911]
MPGVTELASALLKRLDDRLPAAGDPVRAAGMAAYMRDQFAYAGVPAPALRGLEREVFAGLPKPGADDLRAIALACWERAEREYQYVACDYLRKHVACADAAFLPTLAFLITTKSWWDTVDALATRFTGDLVRRDPALVTAMDEWSGAPNMWLIRTAILHQLHYGEHTDTGRLFGYCLRQAAHRDFFVRKAIGWALRHYARTDPEAVRAFINQNRSRLSPLSVKEATKHL